MSLFFEASALTSAYVKDDRTPRVLPLLAQTHPVISALSLVEVRSGIRKALRIGSVTKDESRVLLQAFASQQEFMLKIEVTEEVIDLASRLVETSILKAGDSIQLATFSIYRAQFDPESKLVNADNQIHNAANELKLPVIDVRK